MPSNIQTEVDPDVAELLAPFEHLDLAEEDGIPLESAWHLGCMNLLIASVLYHQRDRTDFYVGGNMFIYFNLQQARDRDFRGPDFFLVQGGVNLHPNRRYWAVWDEGGRYPVALDGGIGSHDEEARLRADVPHQQLLLLRPNHTEARRMEPAKRALRAVAAERAGAAVVSRTGVVGGNLARRLPPAARNLAALLRREGTGGSRGGRSATADRRGAAATCRSAPAARGGTSTPR
jgi:hypothetical protein